MFREGSQGALARPALCCSATIACGAEVFAFELPAQLRDHQGQEMGPRKANLKEAHMLRSIALVTTSLLLASPALAADPAMVVAEKDGFRFEYAKELQPGDRVRLYGRYLDNKEDFSFVVEPNGDVHGEVGRTSVSFSVRRRERDRLVASLKRNMPVSVAQSTVPALAAASAE